MRVFAKIFHVSVAVTLVASCLGAAEGPHPDKALGFGTADIPRFSRQLVNQTSPRTVQLIVDAVKTSPDPRRLELISDLGACQNSMAEPTLCDLLRDPSTFIRAEAVRSLAEIHDQAAIPSLRSVYRDPEGLVRREAIVAGIELGDLDATRAGLADSDEAVIQAACTHLGNPQSISIVGEAVRSLPTQPRIAALQFLAIKTPPQNKWQTFAGCLKGSTSERYAALRVLTALAVADSSATIIPCLHDESSIVRRQAVVALGRTASVSERQTMAMHMLADPDLSVRCAAADVIASNPTDLASGLLLEQLSNENQSLRTAARVALVAIGPASTSAAEKLLTDANDDRKADGSFILGGLRSRDRLQDHIALLNSSNWQLVLQAAKSLDEIGDSSAGPTLAAVVAKISQVQSENYPDADNAFVAISASIVSAAHLGYAALVPVIQPLVAQRDCQPDVRDASIYALGLLGSASDSATCNRILAIAVDPLEAVPTRVEAVKALGHLRFRPADQTLTGMAETDGNLQMRWLAHWAHERLSGKTSEFNLPPLYWSADVAISDLGAAANDQQLSATLGFDGSYLSDAWVPIHFMIRNGRSEQIHGCMSFAVDDGSQNAIVRVPCTVPPQSLLKVGAYGYFAQKPGASLDSAATVADWMDADGRRIARTPVAATALSAKDGFSPQSAHSLDTLILCLVDPTDEATALSSEQGASRLASAISERIGFAVKAEMLPITEAPRQAVGYDSCRIVLLQANPEKLNIAQRQALLDHIRMGGELLICGTAISPNTWLSQYQPVIPLGQREASVIENSSDSAKYPLSMPSMIVEAADVASTDSRVLVAGPELIHAACRPLGLGYVVFTSFEVDALADQDEGNSVLWKNLLLLSAKSSRKLPASAAELLGHLVGIPAAPLTFPIAIICAYIATLFVSQRFFSGGSRPWAFAVTVGVGVIVFISLVAISVIRTSHNELNGGRITMLSLGPSGGGRQEDLLAFAGADDPSLQLTGSDNAVIRPLTTSEREEVQIQQLPFEVARAHVHLTEVQQVWMARRPIDAGTCVKATANFGPSGVTISVTNGLNMPLRNPLLIWGDPWRLSEIPPGISILRPQSRNPAGDFLSANAVHSDLDVLRSQIVERVLSAGRPMLAPSDDDPLLLGWADPLPASVAVPDARMKDLSIVCAPISVSQPEPGATVKIDGAFCRIIPGPGPAAPYDPVRHQWIPSNREGDWIIGFAPPAQIGALRPEHVTVNADVSAPTQTITVLRGLCEGAGPRADAPGVELAHWHQPISSVSAEFDCATGDFDSAGRVWLKLHVESGLSTSSPWFFHRLELSYEATVIGNSAHFRGRDTKERIP